MKLLFIILIQEDYNPILKDKSFLIEN